MQWEIPLPRYVGRDFYIWGLTRAQSVPYCIEDLPLAETAESGGIVRRQIASSCLERADLKILVWCTHTREPPIGSRTRNAAAVTIAAAVLDSEVPSARYLRLTALTH